MTKTENLKLGFASDNTAGAHPLVLEALAKVNQGYQKPYGIDEYCMASDEKFKEIFGDDIVVCLALNGTGANVLALRVMLRTWEGVICTDVAHINTDESGAPEFILGAKMLARPAKNGKLTIADIDHYLQDGSTFHRACAGVVSLTQSTEVGTVYSIEELKSLCEHAHKNGLLVHMDGSRLSNACASLGVGLKEMTRDVGIDVLSLGGTKNGLVFGEAIVFFNAEVAKEYMRIRKQSLQLISKMRFLATQFLCYFENDLWLENAKKANNMTTYLATELSKIDGLSMKMPQSNAVFVKMDKAVMDKLMESYYCYEVEPCVVRLMCSFATTKEEVDDLISFFKQTI